MDAFSGLILSLPARHAAVRVRVWRALKEAGCAVLRDGVYVLPADGADGAALTQIESQIRAAGGFAMIVELRPKTAEQAAQVRKLFDRGGEYGALVRSIDAAKESLARPATRKARTRIERLQRTFDKLARIDFYPSQAKLQAAEALAALKRAAQQADGRGEPHASKKRLRPVDSGRYRRRLWATRKDAWVDRLASAWLIKRFIDRDAKFAWIDQPRERPRKAVGFDFDRAEFTHVGNRVTFEVLLASFGLEDDAALRQIGGAVHFLDVGGIPVPEAKGLEMLLRGAKEKARDDDALLADAMRIFDLCYAAYANTGKGSREVKQSEAAIR